MTAPETTEIATITREDALALIKSAKKLGAQFVEVITELKHTQAYLCLGYDSHDELVRQEFRATAPARSIEQQVRSLEIRDEARREHPELFVADPTDALNDVEAWDVLGKIPVEPSTDGTSPRIEAIKKFHTTVIKDPSNPVNTAKAILAEYRQAIKRQRGITPSGPDVVPIVEDHGERGDGWAAHDALATYLHSKHKEVESYPARSWTQGEIATAMDDCDFIDGDQRKALISAIQDQPADEAISPARVCRMIKDAPIAGLRRLDDRNASDGHTQLQVAEWSGEDIQGRGTTPFQYPDI